jgi:hypothetical protein
VLPSKPTRIPQSYAYANIAAHHVGRPKPGYVCGHLCMFAAACQDDIALRSTTPPAIAVIARTKFGRNMQCMEGLIFGAIYTLPLAYKLPVAMCVAPESSNLCGMPI